MDYRERRPRPPRRRSRPQRNEGGGGGLHPSWCFPLRRSAELPRQKPIRACFVESLSLSLSPGHHRSSPHPTDRSLSDVTYVRTCTTSERCSIFFPPISSTRPRYAGGFRPHVAAVGSIGLLIRQSHRSMHRRPPPPGATGDLGEASEGRPKKPTRLNPWPTCMTPFSVLGRPPPT